MIKVSDLLQFYPTNSLSWEQLNYDNGELQNLHYGLIHKGVPTIVDIETDVLPYISNGNEPRNYTVCECGDVAFADASEDTNDVGKAIELVNVGSHRIVCGLHTIHGRDKKGETISGFKGYAFASKVFHNQVRRIAQGTKIYSICAKNFNEIFIGIPQKEEQAKIARLLRLIDERITTQNKIIEDLKKLKSAIIENTFSQKTSVIQLSEILEQVSIRAKDNNKLPVLSVSNTLGFIAQSEQFESREVASADTSNYKIVSEGIIAYNPARINVGSVACCGCGVKGIVSPMYVCFRTKANALAQYVFHYMRSRFFQIEMEKRLEGSVRLCLTFEGLCNINIPLPELNVQRHLMERIDAITHKIELEMAYYNLLQRQRQYLLTKMFI